MRSSVHKFLLQTQPLEGRHLQPAASHLCGGGGDGEGDAVALAVALACTPAVPCACSAAAVVLPSLPPLLLSVLPSTPSAAAARALPREELMPLSWDTRSWP